MEPETLDAALAWLAEKRGKVDLRFAGRARVWVPRVERAGYAKVINGDIPAAIVEAVGQVWDQVNGNGEP